MFAVIPVGASNAGRMVLRTKPQGAVFSVTPFNVVPVHCGDSATSANHLSASLSGLAMAPHPVEPTVVPEPAPAHAARTKSRLAPAPTTPSAPLFVAIKTPFKGL